MSATTLAFQPIDIAELKLNAARYAQFKQPLPTTSHVQHTALQPTAPSQHTVVQFPVQADVLDMYNMLHSRAANANKDTYVSVLTEIAAAVASRMIDPVQQDMLVNAMWDCPTLKVKRSTLVNTLAGYIKDAKHRAGNKDADSLNSTMYKANLLRKPEFVDFTESANGTKRPTNTFANIGAVIEAMGIVPRHNEVSNRITFTKLDDAANCHDNDASDDVISSRVANAARWAGLNVLSPAAAEAITHFGVENTFNPVREWLDSGTPWDGFDRITQLADTLVGSTDPTIKLMLVTKWLVGAIQGALAATPEPQQGALVLQGGQGLGKTTWFSLLVPDRALFKGGHVLDAHDKDSVAQATACWITELGELESTFGKRAIGVLRGFITQGVDTYRAPYARSPKDHKRRTAFGATVNSDKFLVDEEGNRRWWTINVTDIKRHSIDIRQLWLQARVWWESGCTFNLNKDEQARLEQSNAAFEQGTQYAEQFAKYIELPTYAASVKDSLEYTTCVTTMDVLRALGMKEDRSSVLQAAKDLRKMGAQYVDTRVVGTKVKGFMLLKDWMQHIEGIKAAELNAGATFRDKRRAAAAAAPK